MSQTKVYKSSAQDRARAQAYYLANRELCIQQSTRRNKENREARLATTRRFYENHKERWPQWRANNPDKLKTNSKVYVYNRVARLKHAQGKFTKNDWLAKVEYHGWRCFYCKRELTPATLTRDHRKPITRKGTNWLANLVPACRSCNARKFNH